MPSHLQCIKQKEPQTNIVSFCFTAITTYHAQLRSHTLPYTRSNALCTHKWPAQAGSID